ncbi:hypothetical protein ACP70R_029766 [Stipagrostis hirtigluma subsp. patula]
MVGTGSTFRTRQLPRPLHFSRAASTSPAATAATMPPPLAAVLLALLAAAARGEDIISKSQLERCVLDSGAGGRLSCGTKVVLSIAVPSNSSGEESSLVARVREVGEKDAEPKAVRDPPVITISKSAVYALYALTYLADVVYKPEEQTVETRKCEPDADAKVVKSCERLWDGSGNVIKYTEPVCFDKMIKGKANTAHCLRFPGDRFHVWGIGTRSLGFSIRVQVKKGSSVSEVVVSPENRTVVSGDNFLRVNLVGDFGGYTSIPSFEDFYLVTPRMGAGDGQPEVLGDDYSRWMLLERVRFALNGRECNKIGVSYEAFQNQPDFCSSPIWSCLYKQLWNFWEDDKSRIDRKLQPQYIVDGSFSLGITEVLNTNLLVELSADDIQYIIQRSPGKIISVNISTFEALSQIGTAKVTAKNIGKLEASYYLTFHCLSGINYMEEKYFIMKPNEVIVQSFSLHSSTDQATTARCEAILKASDFSELDKAECQFSTTATVFNNGTQTDSSNEHEKGFFESVIAFWRTLWDALINFFTGTSCRTKCSSFFDLKCHIQYICIDWLIPAGLLLLLLPSGASFLWILHQKGLFDPLYDCWDDLLGQESHTRHTRGHHHHHRRSHRHGDHVHRHHHEHRRRSHHHHHVVHGHGGAQADPVAEGHRHRRDMEPGVQHMDGHRQRHRHRHGEAVAAAAPHWDAPSREAAWLRGEDDGVERRERRRHERHAGHGQHDRERHHSRAV